MKGPEKIFFKPFLFLLIPTFILSDSFDNNFYNNHGSVGLINTPTARFFDEEVHGINLYDGTPDQKISLTSNPYDWLEASFFYTNIQGKPYPGFEYQDYKDKGFNLKVRLKKEGNFPAVAIGLNDFAGTGLYSSEYIVTSYGIKNFDFHFGIGWGQLNGDSDFKNPLSYISNRFSTRPIQYVDEGGSFNLKQYFSGANASPFYGVSYRFNENLFFNFEKDPTKINGPKMPYPTKKNEFSYGLKYKINNNYVVSLSHERGSYFSMNFTYKNNPRTSIKNYEYREAETSINDNSITKLIKNLEENGIGVNRISQTARSLGLELTQFIHSDMLLVEEIIKEAKKDSGIDKSIKTNIKIANLDAINEIDELFQRNAKTIYERETKRTFNTNNSIRFRPFLASREEFFKGALLVENDTEVILQENLFFNLNLKYSLANNFDDLRFPPVDTFPAQVRSDIKQYLKNMDEGILVGRAQLDYHYSHNQFNHIMVTGGILEDMFSGIGAEYLYFEPNTNYSIGFEIFHIKKRNYKWRFGHLDYKNTTYSANFYYRNYGSIPFDMKLSIGEYLAGDKGATIELIRNFRSGVKFGVFATFTDVSAEEFGEGSFDKGIFFNVPIYGNFINYSWRPLTKDPGAKLIRRNNLHDLLVRFKPLG